MYAVLQTEEFIAWLDKPKTSGLNFALPHGFAKLNPAVLVIGSQ